ncbi:MAG: DUF192 domain-containing protein [Nanoarchaeota archaeon]|nr:DUF192 domain-containing protein [Nanoarchaeota archaeon]
MLFDKTRKIQIVEQVILCKTILSKTKGLMFSKKIVDSCLIFFFEKPTIVGLHMFFVFFPIDVLFLDKDRIAVEIKENFRPFALYTPKKKASYVVELPFGIIKEKGISVGDELSFADL